MQDSGIITKPDFFVFIVGMSDKDKEIKPGDHELRPDMAYETILSELISDPMDSSLSVSVTFPEGMRLVDAADLLEENNVCDADEFLDYFNHSAKFGYAYEDYLPSFKKILPHDYSRMMQTIAQFEEKGMTREQAEIDAFYACTQQQ